MSQQKESRQVPPQEQLDERLYADFILRHMPRVLSQVNRDIDLKTYGSCDRNYWHQNIRDFSSAILQQTCLTLALVYKQNFSGNIYHGNENVRTWAIAVLRYMGKIQLRDGSFNEYYPNEHGFPPTAFNLFAGCKTYQILALDDAEILRVLGRAARWLCEHDEKGAYNQEIASISGLYQYYLITKETKLLDIISRKVSGIMKTYSKEGWFPEYGGADIGYSSVALDMLAEYYAESKDERVRLLLVQMVDFLSHFVHPDGTVGGEYGSRNTVYFLPAGLENCVQMGLNRELAEAMIQKLYAEHKCENFMDSVDDRYMTHYVMHSYLRALALFSSRPVAQKPLPCCTVHNVYYPTSGLFSMFNGTYYAVGCLKKGGVLKVYRDGRELFLDCGYRIPYGGGKIAATNWLDSEYEVLRNEESCEVRGKFSLIKPKTQNPVYHFLLRIAALIRGGQLYYDIKRITIFQNAHCDVGFVRRIVFGDKDICIEDTIHNPTGKIVRRASNISLRMVASAKFFSRSDLLSPEPQDYGTKAELKIVKTLHVCEGKMEETVNGA